MVRHDGDDPYLVVAADKGTATFSDIANEISAAHDFWLGDAFASGGSAGYDHKGMAITARGAWECVKRHFREMDIDIQRQPFRVVGVGDMSGDVFGNGMLLSPSTSGWWRPSITATSSSIPIPAPAAASPSASACSTCRARAGRTTTRRKISKGGGVFSRARQVDSAQRRDAGRCSASTRPALTPNELMRAILKCQTDLLWFGGIGTYRARLGRDRCRGRRSRQRPAARHRRRGAAPR